MSRFCRCGAGLCGTICCKTMQNPKTCDGIWHGGIIQLLKRGKIEL